MVSQTGISIFTCYVHSSKTKRDGKKRVANLDSAPQNYPRSNLNLSATKILLNSVVFVPIDSGRSISYLFIIHYSTVEFQLYRLGQVYITCIVYKKCTSCSQRNI